MSLPSGKGAPSPRSRPRCPSPPSLLRALPRAAHAPTLTACQFPEWLADNESKLSTEDYERCVRRCH